VRYPSLRVFEFAVERLRELYPGDPISWRGDGRRLAEQAVAGARWAFQLSRGEACYERKLWAAAALFYEVIMLHPLTDGNKRLASIMLWAFLRANGLPKPRRVAHSALRVAGGEWGLDDVYKWLLRVYKRSRSGERR
jgi:hypothetical protein